MSQPAQEQAIVVFTVADHPYAIPTTRTREVVAWRSPRPLPGADGWIEGVINLRGEIIPICDLALALGVGRRGTPTLDTSIVIIETGGDSFGLIVDGVREVLIIDDAALLDPGAGRHPSLVGILHHGDDLIVVLDPDAAIEGGALPVADLLASARAAGTAQDGETRNQSSTTTSCNEASTDVSGEERTAA